MSATILYLVCAAIQFNFNITRNYLLINDPIIDTRQVYSTVS